MENVATCGRTGSGKAGLNIYFRLSVEQLTCGNPNPTQ